MLTGSYLRSLDAKCRIALPKAVRDVFEREVSINQTSSGEAQGETTNQADPKSAAPKSAAPNQDSTDLSTDARAVFLTPGTDGSLDLYSPAEFHELVQRIHARSSASVDGRAFRRLFYAQAQRIEIDRQGRFRIPAELMVLASLAREVMLVGVGDHMELWNPDSWRTYLAEKQLHFDEIAEKTLERPAAKIGD